MKKVLIVEDNKSELDSLKTAMMNAAFDVSTAPDGKAALSLLTSNSYDLVILDIMLPLMNGLQILHWIRENASTMALPVIILTNLDTDDATLEQITRDKPSYYFIKSNINLDELVDKARSIFNDSVASA